MILLDEWASSWRAATHALFFKQLFRSLYASCMVFAITVATVVGFIVGAPLWLKQLVAVPPVPFFAVITSIFYLPALFYAASEQRPAFSYAHMAVRIALFYLLVGGVAATLIYLVLHSASWPVLILSYAAALAAGVWALWYGLLSPVASIACVYAPAAKMKKEAFWAHVYRMMQGEMPFIFLLLVYAMPFGLVIYNLPRVLIQSGCMNAVDADLLGHCASIIYWQCAWIAFIVFYQERKQNY
jgi:hypothetical protein